LASGAGCAKFIKASLTFDAKIERSRATLGLVWICPEAAASVPEMSATSPKSAIAANSSVASADAARQSARRISVLDGYRALAIFAVLAFHYTIRWAAPSDPAGHFPAGAIFNGVLPLEYGWLGVEFFFIISGFVILMTLERCRNLGDFAARRFARLWPPLIVAATLTTIVVFLIGPPDWHVGIFDYITSVSLISPAVTSGLFHDPNLQWVDGAYWSLWVEVRFYVLAALVYLAVRRNFITLWLCVQAASVGAALLMHVQHQLTPVLDLIFFPSHMLYFTFGVCIYEIYSEGPLRRLALAGAVTAACIILGIAALGLDMYAGKNPVVCVAANLAMFVLFFLFVIDHPLVGIFKARAIVVLGQASYSLYLIHQNIGVSIMRKGVEWGVPYLVVLPLTIGLIVATALLLFHFVEMPAKSWILKGSRSLIAGIDRRMPWLSFQLRPHARE
jgi:peptidoglycan/LPS O-acetylase OafA/YrhL